MMHAIIITVVVCCLSGLLFAALSPPPTPAPVVDVLALSALRFLASWRAITSLLWMYAVASLLKTARG